MKPYQEDREADPKGLLLQPTFGKAIGTSPYHQVEGNQHRVKLLAGGGQQPYAVQRPDGIEAHDTGNPVASDDKEVEPLRLSLQQSRSTRRQFCQPSPWKPVKAAKAVIFR